MTLAEVLASVDRDSRDALVLAVEDALTGHGAPEHPRWRHLSAAIAFLVLALLLARLPWMPP